MSLRDLLKKTTVRKNYKGKGINCTDKSNS